MSSMVGVKFTKTLHVIIVQIDNHCWR